VRPLIDEQKGSGHDYLLCEGGSSPIVSTASSSPLKLHSRPTPEATSLSFLGKPPEPCGSARCGR
jgi:hypothetical protein